MTLVRFATKGAPLTGAEHDGNLDHIEALTETNDVKTIAGVTVPADRAGQIGFDTATGSFYISKTGAADWVEISTRP